MKVVTFTSTLYAKRTPEHFENFPTPEIVKEYMGYAGVDSHEIFDIKMDEKNIAMTFKDSATGLVAKYFKSHKMKNLIFSETKNLNSLPFEVLNKLI